MNRVTKTYKTYCSQTDSHPSLPQERGEGGESGQNQYDAQIARWHAIDPLAEQYYSYSPYHFAGNNPIGNREMNGASYYHEDFLSEYWSHHWLPYTDSGSRKSGGVGGNAGAWGAEAAFQRDWTYLGGNEGSAWVKNDDFMPNTPETWQEIGISGYYTTSGGKLYTLAIYGVGVFNFGGIDPLKIHIVRQGETIASLSRLYAVSVEDILKANPNIQFYKGSPMIFEYFPGKTQPLKWKGSLPPTRYVTKVIIPGLSNNIFPSGVSVPSPNWKIDLISLGINLLLNSPHSLLYSGIIPGELSQYRCYYNTIYGGYFEWNIEDNGLMRVNTFESYDHINGTWRGTHRLRTYYYKRRSDDDSWQPERGDWFPGS